MNLINQIVEMMLAKNAKGLAALFDEKAHYDDSCITGMFRTETHLIGRAAIDIHFFNRFVFRTYLVMNAEIKDENTAELDIMNVGQPQKVCLKLTKISDDGKVLNAEVSPL